MGIAATQSHTFKLVGGALCLDFVNTVGNWHDPAQREYLTRYDDLVAWSQQVGTLTEVEARTLRHEASRRPLEAAQVLARAVALRTAIREAALAVAHDLPIDPATLAQLNQFVGELLCASHLVPTAAGLALGRDDDPAALDRVLWPVVRSALELFTSGELQRVRECPGEACGWVFVDASRGGRRRWCDMANCGNVAKDRRHRARQGTPSQGSAGGGLRAASA
jgi:predicted RNA-binding Zn ribbon-like protein